MKRIIDVKFQVTKRGLADKRSSSEHSRRRAWLEKQAPVCSQCHKTVWFNGENGSYENRATVDHIIPLALGGNDFESNWLIVCRSCNLEKGSGIFITQPSLGEEDLTGVKFGRLVVLGKFIKRGGNRARWVVKCDCGRCEVRSRKAIKNGIDPVDCCLPCKKKHRK